jgi:hypothetical protein
VLHEHRRRQLEGRMEWGPAWVDSGRVFTRENGEQLRSGTVTGRFVQLAEEADLPNGMGPGLGRFRPGVHPGER